MLRKPKFMSILEVDIEDPQTQPCSKVQRAGFQKTCLCCTNPSLSIVENIGLRDKEFNKILYANNSS